MSRFRRLWLVVLGLSIPLTMYAQNADDTIPIYKGSKVIHDDKIGFEEYMIVTGDSTVKQLEGRIRRQFCLPPEGRSPLEIVRNYQQAIKNAGGRILFTSRDPASITIDDKTLKEYFFRHRINHTRNEHYMMFGRKGHKEYLAAVLPTDTADVYIALTAGSGFKGRTVFDLVTIETEPMDMGMVSLDSLAEGLAAQGKVAVYDIYFDSGKSEVKAESSEALQVIAEFLDQNPESTYLVVGHTDNVGDFDMNIRLSTERANAVVEKLVAEYGVQKEQLKPYGVGPAAPVSSNATDEGRAKNRRVEIVER